MHNRCDGILDPTRYGSLSQKTLLKLSLRFPRRLLHSLAKSPNRRKEWYPQKIKCSHPRAEVVSAIPFLLLTGPPVRERRSRCCAHETRSDNGFQLEHVGPKMDDGGNVATVGSG